MQHFLAQPGPCTSQPVWKFGVGPQASSLRPEFLLDFEVRVELGPVLSLGSDFELGWGQAFRLCNRASSGRQLGPYPDHVWSWVWARALTRLTRVEFLGPRWFFFFHYWISTRRYISCADKSCLALEVGCEIRLNVSTQIKNTCYFHLLIVYLKQRGKLLNQSMSLEFFSHLRQ